MATMQRRTRKTGTGVVTSYFSHLSHVERREVELLTEVLKGRVNNALIRPKHVPFCLETLEAQGVSTLPYMWGVSDLIECQRVQNPDLSTINGSSPIVPKKSDASTSAQAKYDCLTPRDVRTAALILDPLNKGEAFLINRQTLGLAIGSSGSSLTQLKTDFEEGLETYRPDLLEIYLKEVAERDYTSKVNCEG